jgi:tetratricopeptide (TPR) repeat protein
MKQGELQAATECFEKAIELNPEYTLAWHNLKWPLLAMSSGLSTQDQLNSPKIKIFDSDYSKALNSILVFELNLGRSSAKEKLRDALDIINASDGKLIVNPNPPDIAGNFKKANNTFALVHFGRSGTGLVHSLIDGHPEVTSFPSIYFSEYFDKKTWERIVAGGWNEMPERFALLYEVLFDAGSLSPIPMKNGASASGLGIDEGLINVGQNKDEVLTVDMTVFCSELKYQMDRVQALDPLTFFELAHMAYDVALNRKPEKTVIFYHIHHPDLYARLNFITLAPAAKWLMMVREPIQSCESWIKDPFASNDMSGVANSIVSMLFEIDNPVYTYSETVGVRLEDIKNFPKVVIPRLCAWMGIKENETLYEMTAQGKQWWGCQASIDYETDGMNPFGKKSINRKSGEILSERDRFVLRTLYYPFRKVFEYTDEDDAQFKKDLKKIRPMLGELFDFQKTMIASSDVTVEEFRKQIGSVYLASRLRDRWETLEKFGTYPDLIKPLLSCGILES